MSHNSLIPVIVFILALVIFLNLVRSDSRIDLNTATQQQLASIKGIGPAFAARIIMERDRRGGFRSVNDLLKVRGVGRKLLARLRPYVKVDPLTSGNSPVDANKTAHRATNNE